MNLRRLLSVSMLAILAGTASGCYYYGVDRVPAVARSANSYREGFRDGRSFERRRDNWRDDRYRWTQNRDRW